MLARQLRACAALSLSFLALGALEGSASGEEPRKALVFFEWTRAPGAETCSSREELVEDVELTLRTRPFAPLETADRRLRAAIARSEGETAGWIARIGLFTRNGDSLGAREITIQGETCAEASEAIVLALSLMVELPLTAPEIEARRVLADDASRWHLEGHVGPALVIDEAPSAAPGLNLGLVLLPKRVWPIALDVLASLRSGTNPEQGRYWLATTTLALSVCPVVAGTRPLRVLACAGPEITTITAWGGGFATDRFGLSSTFGAWIHGDATYELARRIHAFVSLGIVATPQQLELTFADPQGVERRLYQTRHVTGLFTLGLTAKFF